MNEDEIRQIHLAAARLERLTRTCEPGLITYQESLVAQIGDFLDLLHELKHPRVMELDQILTRVRELEAGLALFADEDNWTEDHAIIWKMTSYAQCHPQEIARGILAGES